MLRRALDDEHDGSRMEEAETDRVKQLPRDGAAKRRERRIDEIANHDREKRHDDDFLRTVFADEPARKEHERNFRRRRKGPKTRIRLEMEELLDIEREKALGRRHAEKTEENERDAYPE